MPEGLVERCADKGGEQLRSKLIVDEEIDGRTHRVVVEAPPVVQALEWTVEIADLDVLLWPGSSRCAL